MGKQRQPIVGEDVQVCVHLVDPDSDVMDEHWWEVPSRPWIVLCDWCHSAYSHRQSVEIHNVLFEVPEGISLDKSSSSAHHADLPWVVYGEVHANYQELTDQELGALAKEVWLSMDDAKAGAMLRSNLEKMSPQEIMHWRATYPKLRKQAKTVCQTDFSGNAFWTSLSNAQRVLIVVRRGLVSARQVNADEGLKQLLQRDFLKLLFRREGFLREVEEVRKALASALALGPPDGPTIVLGPKPESSPRPKPTGLAPPGVRPLFPEKGQG